MQIVLDRNTLSGKYQKIVWGEHAGKIWTAMRGGCARHENNPDTVYGMVLSSMEVYTEFGVYVPFYKNGGCKSYWLDASDAILADFEQHTVFASGAVWLWLILGTCAKECLIPKADLFYWIPAEQQVGVCSQPWQTTAAIMCTTLAAAVARDEYALGV